MNNRALEFFSKAKYELVILVLLCVQACLNIDLCCGMSKSFLVYYLADFSMGKTSRLLIGSIVNLLTDNPTLEWINCFAAAVLFLTFVLTAVLTGKIIKSVDKELQGCVFVLSLFFVSGEFSVSTFSKFFGMGDVYMYLITVISLVIVQKRLFKWLLPLLCISGVLINYVFTISFFLPIGLAVLYYICTQEKKLGNITLLTVLVVSVIALMLYCLFLGNKTATVTFDEMWRIMEEKSGIKFDYDAVNYYDFYLFGNDDRAESFVETNINDATPVEFLIKFMKYTLEYTYNLNSFISVFAVLVPMLVFFCALWIKCIKISKTKPRKFVYACFMLSNLGMLICCATSTDLTRWVAAGMINQFLLCLFMLWVRDEPFAKTLKDIKTFFKGKGIIMAVVYIIYVSSANLTLAG